MKTIIDLYKNLDIINLIIFWGIVVVIILIIVLIIIMITKKRKMKKIITDQDNNYINYEEELPIKQEESTVDNYQTKESTVTEEFIVEEEPNNEFENNENNENLQPELKKEVVDIPFIKEEDISPENPVENNKYTSKTIEIPTRPYQRNVLREMSLSQTSPIGINRKNENEIKKSEMVKELSKSLNYQNNDKSDSIEITRELKKELTNTEDFSKRKTEIINKPQEELKSTEPVYNSNKGKNVFEEKKTIEIELPKELLEIKTELKKEPNKNDAYLEEVSKKLLEVEDNNQIERTNYEIQQEEDAIISYTELMEKKDSIQTIDEEDAIISIEELMNRANNKDEEPEIDSRLYNISETEENDKFINELKQFRNDL